MDAIIKIKTQKNKGLETKLVRIRHRLSLRLGIQFLGE